jgi:glutathione synthase/RimK-type ligase-like ATP-grasp enzyme
MKNIKKENMNKNIIIASTSPKLYTTRRLMKEAFGLKRSPIWVNPYNVTLPVKKKPLEGLYLHRSTGTNYDDFDLIVSSFHEISGMKVSNPLLSIKNFRTKDQQSLFFLEHSLPSITALLYRGEKTLELEASIDKIARANKSERFILKMSRGNQGIGVNIIESKQSLYSLLETFHAMKDQRFLIQPHIAHKKEWRFFITRTGIMACIERSLNSADFRGNSKRSTGKILKKIPLELQELTEKAFSKSGLDYAGVDILESMSGEYLILEVNAIPGFEQAEELSGKNIARELLIL